MTTTTLTLADFLEARIAEDEAAARTATPGPWETEEYGDQGYYDIDHPFPDEPHGSSQGVVSVSGGWGCSDHCRARGPTVVDAYHIARHDPARVLAECEAKRRIVELCEPHEGCSGHPGSYMPHGDYGPGLCRRWADDDPIVRLLAEVYADHPDYRDEWRP